MSQLLICAAAIRIPRMPATAATSRGHATCPGMSLSTSAKVRPLTDCQSKGAGCACFPPPENRDASDPFSHRKAPEHTKTAKKTTVLALRIVQNTLRYPTAENQAQSTRKSPASPSRIRPDTKTMAAMMAATMMALNGIVRSVLPPRDDRNFGRCRVHGELDGAVSLLSLC